MPSSCSLESISVTLLQMRRLSLGRHGFLRTTWLLEMLTGVQSPSLLILAFSPLYDALHTIGFSLNS